jgi:O-antigen/teichoic acid export membrane protein
MLTLEGFGVYGLSASLLVILSVFSGVMQTASGVQMNKIADDEELIINLFNNSISIGMIIGLLQFVIIFVLSGVISRSLFDIPDDYVDDFSLIVKITSGIIVVMMINNVIQSFLISKHYIYAFVFLGMIDPVFKLSILYVSNSSDNEALRIFYYSALAAQLITLILGSILVTRIIGWRWIPIGVDLKSSIQYRHFYSWNLFGAFAHALKDGGVNVILNLYFGVAVNGARTISYQIYNLSVSLSNQMGLLLNREINRNVGSNRYSEVELSVANAMRYYIILGMPVVILMHFFSEDILFIWIGSEYSNYAVYFIEILSILLVSELASKPLISLILATNKIKEYQLVVGAINLGVLPLSMVAIELTNNPVSTVYIAILISIVAFVARLIFSVNYARFNIRCLKYTFVRILFAYTVSLILNYYLDFVQLDSFVRLTLSILITACVGILIGLKRNEKEYIYSVGIRLCRKLG